MKALAAYPEYKESGVAWAPRLPAGWAGTRLSRVSTIYAGGTPDRTNPNFWTDGTVPWLNSGSVNDGVITSHSELITQQAATGSSTRWAHPGSVVIALAGQGKTKAMAARLEISSTFNQSMAAIVPNPGLLNYRFLHHWLTSNYQSIRNLAGGDLRDGLNLQHVGSIQVPLPPLAQQIAIAGFLDRETTEIDSFIADQEELIGLLTERRAATITHAVTKGLDPSAPMKDSGVEWLGEVPATWALMSPRRVFRQRKDLAAPSDKQLAATQEYGVIPQDRYTELTGYRVTQVLKGFEILKHVERGDFVISMRSFQGGLEYAHHAGKISSAYVMLHPQMLIADRFFRYLFKSSGFIAALRSTSNLVRDGQAMRFSNVAQVQIPVPDFNSQTAIADYLDHETAELDAAAADAHEAIALSKERRAALISAAVTGEIDVRGLA